MKRCQGLKNIEEKKSRSSSRSIHTILPLLYHQVYSCRKERRIFEAYQQEATSARDKRDKEDIENLRTEVLGNSIYENTPPKCVLFFSY